MTDVFAILWFDTEDFITPESDDIPRRIALLMSKHRVRVVFKIVGEKLRVLKKRGRSDVLSALARHDIGYHSNLHSVHPIMSEYVGNLGWKEGADEFEAREKSGHDEIKEAFGRVNSFGHPGLSWVPQAYPVLTSWGVGVYLDETFTIETMNERPFWYGNMLNIMCIRSGVLTLDASGPYNPDGQGLLRIREQFGNLYRKLESQKGEPGVVSVFCHPTTYATKEFWDVINFSRGRNPREYRKPELKTREETERDFERLEEFVVSAKSLPHLHFITAEDALRIYHDRARERKFTGDDLKHLCESSLRSITFQKTPVDEVWVSAAEIFGMVLYSLSRFHISGELPNSNIEEFVQPLGPNREAETTLHGGDQRAEIDAREFLEACRKEYDLLKVTGYLPHLVRINERVELSAADMFTTCCALYLEIHSGGRPRVISVHKANFEVGKMVTESGASKDWGYYLSPEGFKALEQVKLARLQTWTLKPASADLEKLQVPN